jgi:adenylate cyclase
MPRRVLGIASQSPDNISTWGLVVRSIGLVSKLGRQENEEARSLLERAIAIEPTYAKAHAILSWAVWWAYYNFWRPDGKKVLPRPTPCGTGAGS